jgi:hypothetical protein
MPKTTFIAKLLLPQVRVAWLPSMLKDGWLNKKINLMSDFVDECKCLR